MSWPFQPKKDFLAMLGGEAAKAREALIALHAYVDAPTREHAEVVKTIEVAADALRRDLIMDLNRTFVTPIDREDIFALSRALDDVTDYAATSAEEMELFGIAPDTHVANMVTMLSDAAGNLIAAVATLSTDRIASEAAAVRARKAENAIEREYRQGLVELFASPDVIRILKTREIYRHLSNAADRVVEAANIIEDILVKTA